MTPTLGPAPGIPARARRQAETPGLRPVRLLDGGGPQVHPRVLPATSRRALWSGLITVPLARVVPVEWRGHVLSAIKAFHTAIFFSIGGAVALVLWDGLTGRPRRRTAVAGAVVAGESLVYLSNNQVCPLTPLAEQLGAGRGSVVDIFLPDWAARRIPAVAGSAALLALVLNARALVRNAVTRS